VNRRELKIAQGGERTTALLDAVLAQPLQDGESNGKKSGRRRISRGDAVPSNPARPSTCTTPRCSPQQLGDTRIEFIGQPRSL
jgi:hypothetical protein